MFVSLLLVCNDLISRICNSHLLTSPSSVIILGLRMLYIIYFPAFPITMPRRRPAASSPLSKRRSLLRTAKHGTTKTTRTSSWPSGSHASTAWKLGTTRLPNTGLTGAWWAKWNQPRLSDRTRRNEQLKTNWATHNYATSASHRIRRSGPLWRPAGTDAYAKTALPGRCRQMVPLRLQVFEENLTWLVKIL